MRSRARGQARDDVGDLLADASSGSPVWPCVRLEHRHVGELVRHRAQRGDEAVERRQQHVVARAACSISAWLVLLMSSLVQAKCTNSPAARQLGMAGEART